MKQDYVFIFSVILFLGINSLFAQSLNIDKYRSNSVTYSTHDDDSSSCNSNAYLNSADPNTLEYDNMISGFHQTIVRESSGAVVVWGQWTAPDASNLWVPTEVTPENGFDYEGEILKMAVGSSGSAGLFLLTTEGLYFWGTFLSDTWPSNLIVNEYVNGVFVSFHKVPPIASHGISGVNESGLPMDVLPQDVKMMFSCGGSGLVLTTYDGSVWVMEYDMSAGIRGDGSVNPDLGNWHRVKMSLTEDGQTDAGWLQNIVATRGSAQNMIALTADGDIYTWGMNTYLGDGSEPLTRTMATKMQKPTGDFQIKQIGTNAMVTTNGDNYPTYYVLTTTGELFALGNNSVQQLGFLSDPHSTEWIRVSQNHEGDPLPEIAWISPNEHDWGVPNINAVDVNGELWSWGMNSGGMLGDTDGTIVYPYSGGRNLDDYSIFGVETGGHTTIVVDQCSAKYGYIGHRVDGSMGDNNPENDVEFVFNFENTGIINLCAVQAAPVAFDIELCEMNNFDLNTILGDNENPDEVLWYADEDLNLSIPDHIVNEYGTYYATYLNTNCDEPVATKIEITEKICEVVAQDYVFVLCQGDSTDPNSILDDNWVGDEPASSENSEIQIDENELPEGIQINAEGVISVSEDMAAGTYSFSYILINMENPDEYATGNVTIIVEGIWILEDDYAETYQNESIEINILINDIPGNEDGNYENLTLINPFNLNATSEINLPNEGQFILDVENGSVEFIPEPDFVGLTTPIFYSLENNCGEAEMAEIWVFVKNLALELVKTTDREIVYSEEGQLIEYQIEIINIGNVTLYDIDIIDENSEEYFLGTIEELGPGESRMFTATHLITTEDVEAGFVANIAFADGSDEEGRMVEIYSYDANPLEIDEALDPDCPDCTYVLIEQNEPDEPIDEEPSETDCELQIAQGVSPDGDGLNDFLKIQTGECEGRILIKIFNRWGTLVFESKRYGSGDEVFDGYANRPGILLDRGGRLPSGVYYYVVRFHSDQDKNQRKTGYFYLTSD